MTGLAVVRSPSMNQRRQALLSPKERGLTMRDGDGRVKRGNKFGEVVGGTTAECAAVCCCCPCAVMNLLVLAVYTVPAGLCKKAWRKQRRRQRLARRKQVGGLLMGPSVGSSMEHGAQTQELLEASSNAEENEEALEFGQGDVVPLQWDRLLEEPFSEGINKTNGSNNDLAGQSW